MKSAIIIPAFNEETHISELIDKIVSYRADLLIVIDDGSVIPISKLKLPRNILVISHDMNKGKGCALLSGFNHAYKLGYTHVVTMDADLQHDPRMLDDFFEVDDEYDIVLGTRDFTTNMPVHRRLSNLITSKLVSFMCGRKILDSQCGYRRYKLSNVLCWKYMENGFQFESEILIRMIGLSKGSIKHVPINTIYNSEKSSISHVSDTFQFISMIIRSLFWKKN